MLQDLPPQLRDDLLRFYLELEDDLSLEDSLERFLHSFSSSLPCPNRLVICVRHGQSWLALSSEGQRYQGDESPATDYARPEDWPALATQPIHYPSHNRTGYLTLYCQKVAHRQGAESQLLVWARVAQQLVNRHCYQELHQSYLALVEAAVDAIITIDRHGKIQLFNPGAVKMFGYQPAEIIGQSVNVLMPPPYAGEHDGYMQNYLRTGEKKIIGIGRKVPARRKDGSIFPAHLAVTEFERGGNRYFIGTLRDLSDFVEARSRASVEERKHLSRELHDSVSQALFGIVLGSLAIRNALGNPEQAKEAVDYVLHLAESGLAEMRTLIFELRPESLESEGLLACLQKQTQALAKRYKIEVSLDTSGQEPHLKLPIKHEVYRLIMESLHNVVKHAQASRCRVLLEKLPGEYRVFVEDNGKGFDVQSVPVNRVGLSSMRERVAQLGGRFQIRSAAGQGTNIEVNFPATTA